MLNNVEMSPERIWKSIANWKQFDKCPMKELNKLWFSTQRNFNEMDPNITS